MEMQRILYVRNHGIETVKI